MAYSCPLHGWYSTEIPCPSCQITITTSTTNFASQSQEVRPVWQLCPKCNGEGRISTNGLSTSVHQTCDVCIGAKVIQSPAPIDKSSQKQLLIDIMKEDEKTGVYEGKTIGQIITDAMELNELNPVTVENALDFPNGVLVKIMNDEYYTNSIPVVLFRNLLVSLHIPFSVVEQAMIPTFNLLVSKETVDSIRKKPMGYLLWENVEAVKKYTQQLKQLMKTGVYDSGEVESDKRIDKKLAEMFKENSVKLCQFMLLQIGRLMVEANAGTMDLSQESDLREGERYKIQTVCTLIKVK